MPALKSARRFCAALWWLALPALADNQHYSSVATIAPEAPLDTDDFGSSIGIDGDAMVIAQADGNPADGVSSDAILVYRRVDGAWQREARLLPFDKQPVNLADAVVAISGDHVVIGAPHAGDTEEGRGFLWSRNAEGQWRQVRVLKSSQPSRYANFGAAVDIDRNTLVIGSPFELGRDLAGNGAAHVFQRGSDGWRHARTLNAPADGAPVSGFGIAVAIDSSRIAVGAPFSASSGGVNSAGAALVFARNQGGTANWGRIARLESATPGEADQCGRAVGIAGHRAALGCENAREVWVHRIGSAGTPRRLSDPANEHFFGGRLDLREDRLVVSAPGLRTDITSQVRVFQCPDPAPLQCTLYDTLSAGATQHGFGAEVAIDDAGAIAVTVNGGNGTLPEAGAVLVHTEP